MNHSKSRVRRGNVLVFVVLILVGLIGIMALAVDMGYLYVVRAKLQATAEASALAGASALGLNETTVRQRALDYAAKNTVGGTPVALQDQDIQLGQWNYAARTFNPTAGTNLTPNAVHVTAQLAKSRNNAVGLFFAPILGINTADVGASATAVFGSRDIVLVLDYSASMNDDSSISQSSGGGRTSSSIPKLGRTAVENQIQLMYQQLGSPTYGKLTFTPQASKTGNPLIEFGLSGVKYPYPSGSWSDYINYVAGYPSGTTYDPYRNKFGYLTLIDYWQAAWPSHNQTPDLWKASEEPVASVKDGVTVFLAFMNQQPTDDRIGFVSYTYTDFRYRPAPSKCRPATTRPARTSPPAWRPHAMS
jgi:Flp pilus assembly protein TadG